MLRSSSVRSADVADPEELFDSAERHGVLGVVLDAWRASGETLSPVLDSALAFRSAARELDHEAHLDLLRHIDRRFGGAGLRGVILKGPVFAERFYSRPSARATSDLDLMVAERDLDAACDALSEIGWSVREGPEEDRFRREHHHIHLSHPEALPLELHFHGYVGFGRTLPSEPLVERSLPIETPSGFSSLRVLEPADELLFLAVHGAVHRFVRLGWLYDMRLLVDTMNAEQLALAARRARAWGFGRAFAFTLDLLDELFPARSEPMERSAFRHRIARRVVGEPAAPVLRSATRLVYTLALCDTTSAALRYFVRTSAGHARRAFGLGP